MPAFGIMSADEKTTSPQVVIAEVPSSDSAKSKKTKKYVIIAVSGIVAAAIVLTAILVGMYMFTEAQKEIIKYTLQLSENTKQDVTSDPNENIVQYHVSNPAQETWIINDFGKDLQLMKIKSDGKTNCFVSPLNRTNMMDPAKINGPDSKNVKEATTLTYRPSDTPITDTSFLGKTSREMCKGISVYWLYPQCSDGKQDPNGNFTDVDHPKAKRQYLDYSPYYIRSYVTYLSYYNYQYYSVPCYTGCCRTVCGCTVYYSAYLSYGRMYCTWVTYSCPPVMYSNPLRDVCATGPRGLTCPNRYPAYPPTC